MDNGVSPSAQLTAGLEQPAAGDLMAAPLRPHSKPLTFFKALRYAAGAVAAFHLAYSFPRASALIAPYLYCLMALSRLSTNRRAFYFGLSIGMLIYSVQLSCFYTIYGWAALALWMV